MNSGAMTVVGLMNRRTICEKLRNSEPAVEPRDRGFGDHHAGGVDAEVVATVNESGIAVHQETLAGGRRYVEHDGPAGAIEIAGPGVVGHHDAPVFGKA